MVHTSTSVNNVQQPAVNSLLEEIRSTVDNTSATDRGAEGVQKFFVSRSTQRTLRSEERIHPVDPAHKFDLPSAFTFDATTMQALVKSTSKSPVVGTYSSAWPRSKRDFAPELKAPMHSAELGSGNTRGLSAVLLRNPNLLAELTAPAARWLFTWWYYVHADLNRCRLKKLDPPEWVRRAGDARKILRSDTLHIFVHDMLTYTDKLLSLYKSHERHRIWNERGCPDPAIPLPTEPNPGEDAVRIAARAMYVMMRGLYDSHIIQFFEWRTDIKNSNADRRNYDGGNMDALPAVRSHMDPIVFPHLQGPSIFPHPPYVLVHAVQILMDHLDLFIWAPAPSPLLAEEEQNRRNRHIQQATEWIQKAQEEKWFRWKERVGLVMRIQNELLNKTNDEASTALLQSKLQQLAKIDRTETESFDRTISDLTSIKDGDYMQNESRYPESLNFAAWIDLLNKMRHLYIMRDHIIQLIKFGGRSNTPTVVELINSRPLRFMETFRRTPHVPGDEIGAYRPNVSNVDNTNDMDNSADNQVNEEQAQAMEQECADVIEAATADAKAAEEYENAKVVGVDATIQSVDEYVPLVNDSGSSLLADASVPSAGSTKVSLLRGSTTREFLCILEAVAANNIAFELRGFTVALRIFVYQLTSARKGKVELSIGEVARLVHALEMVELISPFIAPLLDKVSMPCLKHVVWKETPLGTPPNTFLLTTEVFQKMNREHALQDPFDRLRSVTMDTQSPPPLLAQAFAGMFIACAPCIPTIEDVRDQKLLPDTVRKFLNQILIPQSDTPTLRLCRALCDYYLAVMKDEHMAIRHAAVYGKRELKDVHACLVTDMTNFAWSLILMQQERRAFVLHFIHAYIRFAESKFEFVQKTDHLNGAVQFHYRSTKQLVEYTTPHITLNRMHQLSIQLVIRDRNRIPVNQSLMPHGSAADSIPLLPNEINFSAATRASLLHHITTNTHASVSQFALEVYQMLRDPEGRMHFRQRIMHDRIRIRIPHSQRESLWKREQELNQYDKIHTSDQSNSDLLHDRLDPSDAVDEYVPDGGNVDFFVEHRTELGHSIDAAIFMRTDASDAHEREGIILHHRKHLERKHSLVSIPAVQAVLTSMSSSAVIPTKANSEEEIYTLRVALEIDGPWHFCTSDRFYLNAAGRLKQRQFRQLGWWVVSLPVHRWNNLNSEQREEWIGSLLPKRMLKVHREFKQRQKEWKAMKATKSPPQWLKRKPLVPSNRTHTQSTTTEEPSVPRTEESITPIPPTATAPNNAVPYPTPAMSRSISDPLAAFAQRMLVGQPLASSNPLFNPNNISNGVVEHQQSKLPSPEYLFRKP
jgi:hypothetical protein